jgi:hypothetical protein
VTGHVVCTCAVVSSHRNHHMHERLLVRTPADTHRVRHYKELGYGQPVTGSGETDATETRKGLLYETYFNVCTVDASP